MSGLSLPASLLKALESTAFSHAPTDISVTFVQCLGPGPSASPAPQLPECCPPLWGWAAVPSNMVAPGGGGELCSRMGQVCAHRSRVGVCLAFSSLWLRHSRPSSTPRFCVMGAVYRMVLEPGEAAHGGHQRTGSLPPRVSALPVSVEAATVLAPEAWLPTSRSGTLGRAAAPK